MHVDICKQEKYDHMHARNFEAPESKYSIRFCRHALHYLHASDSQVNGNSHSHILELLFGDSHTPQVNSQLGNHATPYD